MTNFFEKKVADENMHFQRHTNFLLKLQWSVFSSATLSLEGSAQNFSSQKNSSIEWEIKKCNLKSKRYKNEFDLIKILKLLCTSFLSFRLLLVSFAFWQHSGFINHEHNEANKFLKKLTYSYSMHFHDHKRWIFNLHLVE